jgi:hypothetical protein
MTTTPPRRLTSADFKIGQEVECVDPEAFTSPTAAYLTNRVGLVDQVTPVTRAERPTYGGYLNSVWVTWQKRGNRGAEKRIRMSPRDLRVRESGSAASPTEPDLAALPDLN